MPNKINFGSSRSGTSGFGSDVAKCALAAALLAAIVVPMSAGPIANSKDEPTRVTSTGKIGNRVNASISPNGTADGCYAIRERTLDAAGVARVGVLNICE